MQAMRSIQLAFIGVITAAAMGLATPAAGQKPDGDQKPPEKTQVKKPKYEQGDRVMARRDGRWYFAEVLEVMEGQYRVRYIGVAVKPEAVVPEAQVKDLDLDSIGAEEADPPGEPAAEPVAGSFAARGKTLSGLYLRQDAVQLLVSGIGGALADNSALFFLPDGHVFAGLPEGGGLESFSYARALMASPDRVGTYALNGDRLTLAWPGKRADTMRIERRGRLDLILDGRLYARLTGWPPAARLDGVYSWDRKLLPGSLSSPTITFRKNGRFELGRPLVTSLAGKKVRPDRYEVGSYSLMGSTLTMVFYPGRIMRFTIAHLGETTIDPMRPGLLMVNGGFYMRRGPAPAPIP